MAYNILGITPAHNASACVLSDGEIVYFLEEERLSRVKRDGNPFRVINDIIDKYKIDEIALAGVNYQSNLLVHTREDMYYGFLRKYYPDIKLHYYGDAHHSIHSFQSFCNSGFTNPLSVIIDGNGSRYKHQLANQMIVSDEIESIFIHHYPHDISILDSTQLCHTLDKDIFLPQFNIINSVGIGKSYEAVSQYLGFGRDECGKTMGLSSYGKNNPLIPSIITKDFRNKSFFKYLERKDVQQPDLKKETFNNYSDKDLAWKIQNDTQQLVGDYIEMAIQKTGITQVCCTGGYFLNCVANYYLTKRFPNIEFYFEPIANDAGTSIGAAKLRWYEKTQDNTIRPQKTLYYGPQYSKDQLLEGIQKYVSN